jgi:protocatechuate 3,4-dioxygenase beta subunit
VVLSSGAPVHDVKVELTPQAVVVGKVVDDQGDPIMNAQVAPLISRVVEGRRSFQQAGTASTNDLGEFRLASLIGGKYIICARANERGLGDPATTGESCYPGPVEAGAASAMELAAGHETRLDFTLTEVPTVHVRGTISGMPKNQGAGITLVKRGSSVPVGNRQARIGPEGTFDVAGVTAGSYMLSTDYFEGGAHLTARVPVEVRNADVDDVAVHLEAGFTVTGRVRMESKAGSAPANRQFTLSLRSTEPRVGSGHLTWSADNSTFTIPDVTPGNYQLDAFPPGPFFVKSATLGGIDILRQEIPIAQAAEPLEIVLSDNSGAMDALVTGADDEPVASSMVMLLQDGLRPRMAASGADGHVKMQGLAPGDYRIYAWEDVSQVEYADADWMKRYGGNGVAVTVEAGRTEQVTVKRQAVP